MKNSRVHKHENCVHGLTITHLFHENYVIKTNVSAVDTLGSKYTLAASVLTLVSHFRTTDRTDQQTDARPIHYAYRYRRGQRNNLARAIINKLNVFTISHKYRVVQASGSKLLSITSPTGNRFSQFFHPMTR